MSADDQVIPASAALEEQVLGACFLHHAVLPEAQRWCAGQDFFSYRVIWDALERMQAKHGRVSVALLPGELQAAGLDEEQALAWEAQVVGWIASCEDHTLIRGWTQELEALGVRRRTIQAAGKIADAAYERTDADAAVAEAYQVLGRATERRSRSGETTLADQAGDLYDRLNSGETIRGLPTGLPRLDQAQKGLRPGELTILAARTAHGKTALALQVARHVAGMGASVAYLSLEMDAQSLTERLVSMEAGVAVRDVLEGGGKEGDLGKVIEALGPLSALPITFSVAPATTMAEVRRVVGRWADAGLANLLIVDYVQLVSLGRSTGNRAYEVGATAQALRDLAQEHRIPVLALAQLNRAIEHRSDQRPVLADLRESGGLEQAADAVWLLHRPGVFSGNEHDPVAEVDLAKNRAGPLAREALLFDAPTTRFRLLDAWHQT